MRSSRLYGLLLRSVAPLGAGREAAGRTSKALVTAGSIRAPIDSDSPAVPKTFTNGTIYVIGTRVPLTTFTLLTLTTMLTTFSVRKLRRIAQKRRTHITMQSRAATKTDELSGAFIEVSDPQNLKMEGSSPGRIHTEIL